MTINTIEMLIIILIALGKIKTLQNRTHSTSFLNITDANQRYLHMDLQYSCIIWTSSDYSHSHRGLEGSLGQPQSCPSSQQL